jgi:hypothetical protein
VFECTIGWIPVAGPWVLLAGGTHLGPMDDNSSVVLTGVLAGVQTLGAGLMIFGLSWRPSQLIRVEPTTDVINTPSGLRALPGMRITW